MAAPLGITTHYPISGSSTESQGDKCDTTSQEHALISTFDLFSIGIDPSSSHPVGPMRAGSIFVADLVEANFLHQVARIRISIYGSLASTGEGHMTPSALLLEPEGADVQTVDTSTQAAEASEMQAGQASYTDQDGKERAGKL
ncbi:hypothetical protein LTR70_010160 [Exophiala xenobiotica]|uniref:Serine dehydratase beta chain domain-containing protein n=1 Tax=Lithohypha guttulata TaxID=1690604 RepID=A0ABR0JVU0_9EURO|nr:hypothetical protein LTR24_010117 [Lithohypha guttulata]KAK5309592.1 hypothetical protein LTR70_010160 [Exophiala xenobiotica]